MHISTSFIFLCISISGLLCSCVTHKANDPLTFPGKTIILGSGGGFAGTEQEYRLLGNGQLYYRSSGNESFRLIDTKSKGKAKKWVARLDSLQLEKVTFNEPGNIYKYIAFKKDSLENRIVWSNATEIPNKAIPNFYQSFIEYWADKKKSD